MRSEEERNEETSGPERSGMPYEEPEREPGRHGWHSTNERRGGWMLIPDSDLPSPDVLPRAWEYKLLREDDATQAYGHQTTPERALEELLTRFRSADIRVERRSGEDDENQNMEALCSQRKIGADVFLREVRMPKDVEAYLQVRLIPENKWHEYQEAFVTVWKLRFFHGPGMDDLTKQEDGGNLSEQTKETLKRVLSYDVDHEKQNVYQRAVDKQYLGQMVKTGDKMYLEPKVRYGQTFSIADVKTAATTENAPALMGGTQEAREQRRRDSRPRASSYDPSREYNQRPAGKQGWDRKYQRFDDEHTTHGYSKGHGKSEILRADRARAESAYDIQQREAQQPRGPYCPWNGPPPRWSGSPQGPQGEIEFKNGGRRYEDGLERQEQIYAEGRGAAPQFNCWGDLLEQEVWTPARQQSGTGWEVEEPVRSLSPPTGPPSTIGTDKQPQAKAKAKQFGVFATLSAPRQQTNTLSAEERTAGNSLCRAIAEDCAVDWSRRPDNEEFLVTLNRMWQDNRLQYHAGGAVMIKFLCLRAYSMLLIENHEAKINELISGVSRSSAPIEKRVTVFASAKMASAWIALTLDPTRTDIQLWDQEGASIFKEIKSLATTVAGTSFLKAEDVAALGNLSEWFAHGGHNVKIHPVLDIPTGNGERGKFIFITFGVHDEAELGGHQSYVAQSPMTSSALGRFLAHGGTFIPGGAQTGSYRVPTEGFDLRAEAQTLADNQKRVIDAGMGGCVNRHDAFMSCQKLGSKPYGRVEDLTKKEGGYGSHWLFFDLRVRQTWHPTSKCPTGAKIHEELMHGMNNHGAPPADWEGPNHGMVWRHYETGKEYIYVPSWKVRTTAVLVRWDMFQPFMSGARLGAQEIAQLR